MLWPLPFVFAHNSFMLLPMPSTHDPI